MSIIISLLIFSVIVIFHEFGHMLLAKKNGIKVVEFSVGLGPSIVSKEFHGTKYSIKILPFGGACQMLGEDTVSDEDGERNLEGSYYSKSVWQRMSVILAGPFFNFILAFILSLFIIGIAGYDPATVTSVSINSPAETAGLEAGDKILKINNSKISIGRQVDAFFTYNGISEEPVSITYERDGEKYETVIYPAKTKKYLLGFTYNSGEQSAVINELQSDYPMILAGAAVGDTIISVNGTEISSGSELKNYFDLNPLTDADIKIVLSRGGETVEIVATPKLISDTWSLGFNYNLYRYKGNALEVVKYSFVEVKYWIQITIKNLGMLFTGQLTKDDVGGVVAIVDMIGDSYTETKKSGTALDVVLQMMYISVLLSANLGVMNLLPIPALDGGKFLFLLVELIIRKPLNRNLEGIVNLIGFVLLMLLMVFVFFNDIRRLFI